MSIQSKLTQLLRGSKERLEREARTGTSRRPPEEPLPGGAEGGDQSPAADTPPAFPAGDDSPLGDTDQHSQAHR